VKKSITYYERIQRAGAMRPDAVQYIGAYFFSIVGGYFIVAWIMRFLRWRLRHPDKGNELDFWLGSTERAVATTLVILAPKYVGPFIGAWIALKMAANWQRLKGASSNSDGKRTDVAD
jgi:hypothetical protein